MRLRSLEKKAPYLHNFETCHRGEKYPGLFKDTFSFSRTCKDVSRILGTMPGAEMNV